MAVQWEKVGQELKRRRTAAKLTQVQLAEKVRVAPNTIARIESGNRRPSLPMLQRIADALKCRVGDLLPGSVGKAVTQAENVIKRIERLERLLGGPFDLVTGKPLPKGRAKK